MFLNEDLNILADDIYRSGIKNSRIVITGATGLLGKIFAKSFLVANKKYGLNNIIYALVRNKQKAYDFLGGVYDESLVISNYKIEEPINIKEDVDYVFHFAAITSSKDMVSHPIEVIESTMYGIFNLLNFSKNHNAKSVVYMSSMEVFGIGDNQQFRLKENDLGYLDLSSVRSCYPESKRLAENYCLCYAREYGLNVKIARLTQTFGAGANYDDSRVFGMIARSVVENKDIILFSKGDLSRDYCYTTDALNAVLQIAQFGEIGEVYNVANEVTQTSVIDMCKMVVKEIAHNNIRVKIEIPEDVTSKGFSPTSITKLDTTKLRELGWAPKFDLKQMYERLIASYEESSK